MSNIRKRWVVLLWIGVLCHAGVGLASTNSEPVNAQAPDPGGMASTNSELAKVQVSEPEWINRDKAEPGSEAEGDGPADIGGSAWRSIGALLFVIGALLAVQIVLKRRAAGRGMASSEQLRAVSRLRIGPRQEIVIVEWEGEQLMLGVSQSSIQSLHRHSVDEVKRGAFEEIAHEL